MQKGQVSQSWGWGRSVEEFWDDVDGNWSVWMYFDGFYYNIMLFDGLLGVVSRYFFIVNGLMLPNVLNGIDIYDGLTNLPV